jgi:hypothetical protein
MTHIRELYAWIYNNNNNNIKTVNGKNPLFCQIASPADIYDYQLLTNELIKILVAQPQ